MQTLIINPEFKSAIDPLAVDEYKGLEESILTEGCRDAIVTWQGVIVDGHNRYEICQKHGVSFDTVEREFSGDDEVKEWIVKNQLARRNLTDQQRRYLIGTQYNSEKVGEPFKGNRYVSSGGNSCHHQKTEQKIAEQYNIAPRTVRNNAEYAKSVDTIAENVGTEVKQKILNNETRLTDKDTVMIAKLPTEQQKAVVEAVISQDKDASAVISEMKKAEKAEQQREAYEKRVEEAAKQVKIVESQPAVKVRPNLVLADPPWRYDFSETDSRKVENQYDTATVEEMTEHLPETQEDCVLLLWATAPKLLEAIKLIGLWGFTYKTHAIWDKEKIGMGYWFRGQHELLIVATKGNASPPMPDFRVSSVFKEERGLHSKKPECVYQWIEQAFADRVKLEMYCREARAGWMVWGNEV